MLGCLYLQILLANLPAFVLRWTYAWMVFCFLVGRRVLNFDHGVLLFQGVFIFLLRTNFVHLRSSITSFHPLKGFVVLPYVDDVCPLRGPYRPFLLWMVYIH